MGVIWVDFWDIKELICVTDSFNQLIGSSMSSNLKNIEESTFRLRSDLHIVRKIWHMSTGLFGLAIYYQSGIEARPMSLILLAIAGVALFVEITRLNFKSINRVVMVLMKPFMRESEKYNMSGFPFYALGAGLSLFLFSEKIAILSILFLIFADPICSYVGILYGKDKIWGKKSLQGFAAGVACCYILTLVYGLMYEGPSFNLLIFAFLGGFIGSVSELFSTFIDDNLTIPLASGLGLSFINLLVPVF
jgi:dolichol kinase